MVFHGKWDFGDLVSAARTFGDGESSCQEGSTLDTSFCRLHIHHEAVIYQDIYEEID